MYQRVLALLFFLVNCWGGLAFAAIGDDCVAGQCTPGEVCLPAEDGPGYCTGRCPDSGCPADMRCAFFDGIELCRRGEPPARAPFGASCADVACESGLLCVSDGDQKYCSRACAGPGACPEGFRCAGGERPACARRAGPPGIGDRCSDECEERFECTGQGDGFQFCSADCANDAECGGYLVCADGRCVFPEAVVVAFGAPCAPDGIAVPIVCAEGLVCHRDGLAAYCTSSCSPNRPCPTEYGCVGQNDGAGACRIGQEDESGFGPIQTRDVPILPAPPVDMGLSNTSEASDSGCAVSWRTGHGPNSGLLWGLVTLVFLRRTRR